MDKNQLIKKIYSFTIDKEMEVEKRDEIINDKGEKVVTISKVKEKTPQKFFIRRPSRSMYDEAQLFHGAKFGEAVRNGVLTSSILLKTVLNDKGTLSEIEKNELEKGYTRLFDIEKELNKLMIKQDKTPEESEKEKSLILERRELRQSIQDLEISKNSMFEHTADTYARNKVIVWWTMFLAYKELADDKFEPFFSGESFEDKYAAYDKMTEDAELFNAVVIQSFMYYTTIWFIHNLNSQEEFDQFLKTTNE